MSAKHIEVNPGELFMMDPEALLVKEYEGVFTATERIGVEGSSQIVYALSFTGRINNTDQERTYTVLMSPEDGFQLQGMLLDQFEWYLTQAKKQRGGN